MKTDKRSVDDIHPDPSNARKHSPRNIDAIAASLHRFGQQKPIVVDSSGVVRAGNGTLEAAKKLGWSEVAVVESDLEGAEMTAFAIADNRTAELAEWDDEVLAATLQALDDADVPLADAGFTAEELAEVQKAAGADEAGEVVEDVEDEVPEAPEEPITKVGDLWILGRHRLLCGDSTNEVDVSRLMDGGKADMVFTDPPYNIAFRGTMSDTTKDGEPIPHVPANGLHAAMRNDKKTPEEFRAFIQAIASAIRQHCSGAYYISFSSGNLHELLTPVSDSIGYKSIVIWVKNQSPMGGGAYRRRYEPIVYGNFSGDFFGTPYSEDDVWEFDRTNKNELHPTMKPVALVANAIKHGSGSEGSVLDLFLGSGTTLIAAEQLGRSCYGMELSPAYCDVIVRRWENLTGGKAELA
ncbi:site-specific DNA-methyltransferase [bacterium]|nr:site-specific DNA-methyltransferase [bacterium]